MITYCFFLEFVYDFSFLDDLNMSDLEQRAGAKHRAVQGVWKLRHWHFAAIVVCFMSCCITYVGVCHAQRWTCRVNLPVQLLSKLMCFYNHGISPLGSWMIVWFQYPSIFAIKATCIRHVSDCFLWSTKKVRFGFMVICPEKYPERFKQSLASNL